MTLGKIAEVDLTSGKIIFADFSDKLAETCLGGLGFNSWYLYKHFPGGSALDPENVLIISCGPTACLWNPKPDYSRAFTPSCLFERHHRWN